MTVMIAKITQRQSSSKYHPLKYINIKCNSHLNSLFDKMIPVNINSFNSGYMYTFPEEIRPIKKLSSTHLIQSYKLK